MSTNNSLNINSSTPLSPADGGTGVSNSTNTLTVTANSSINQNVTTTGTPVFTSSTSGNLNFAVDTMTCSDTANPMTFISDRSAYAAGYFSFGSSTDANLNFLSPYVQCAIDDSTMCVNIMQYGTASAGGGGGTLNLVTSYGTNVGSFATITSATEQIGTINFYGTNNTSYVQEGSIVCQLTQAIPSGSQANSSMLFSIGNAGGGPVTALTLSVLSNSPTLTLTKCNNYFATAPFAGSQTSALTVGTAFHNTLGYDVVLTVYLSVTAATAASILLGVGRTATPTQQTIVSSLTLAAVTIIPVTIYLPAAYFALLSTSGTITQTISGQQIMPV